MSVDQFTQKYGGPAFPTCVSADNSGGLNYGKDGISVRDYFASAALQGYLAAHADPETRLPTQTEIAGWCYDMATRMLEARKGN